MGTCSEQNEVHSKLHRNHRLGNHLALSHYGSNGSPSTPNKYMYLTLSNKISLDASVNNYVIC